MIARRPVRFLVLVIGGWTGVRAVVLWPVAEIVPELAAAVAPPAAAERRAPVGVQAVAVAPRASIVPDRTALVVATRTPARRLAMMRASPPLPAAPAMHHPAGPTAAPPVTRAAPAASIVAPSPGAGSPPTFAIGRLSGSAWAILRPAGRATPFASQLGGSQAGVRIAYAIDRPRRLAIVARAATAIGTRQQEAGIGVDWKPTALPIHLVVEQRIGIAGVRGGQALGAIGGIGPLPIGAGLRLEAYGQAGAIVRDRRVEGFADGQLRATRPVATLGTTVLEAGAGGWGAAQRGAARIDLGPTVGATLPVGNHRLRVALDWRHRIAGKARPGSGPALSVGTHF